jgi:hypothetical protein
MAAMGLVGRDEEGFNVTSPGFRKETFRVWKDEESRVRCSCVEFQEQRESDPKFRCEHILAVKFHLDAEPVPGQSKKELLNGLIGQAQYEPDEPQPSGMAKTMAELVTPRQLVAIRAISNSQKLDAEAECRQMHRCKPEELSRKAASQLIDHLKSKGQVITEDNQSEFAILILKKFTEAVHAKNNGLNELADRVYYEATQLWQRWDEETAILRKPQPRSNGTYNGIEY